jgi:hypothetical protein
MIDTELRDSMTNPAKARIVLLFMILEKKQPFNTLNNKVWTGTDIVTLQKIKIQTPFSFNESYTKIN